jgi:predicted kinase
LNRTPRSNPLVYLLVGLTGSGKTRYSRRLESDGVLRLCVDEEVYALHGRYGVDYPEHDYAEREQPVVEDIRKRLVDAVVAGHSVVLDYGLWRRSEREEYKELVEDAGGSWRLIYLKVSKDELLRRLGERNLHTDANALAVTPQALEDFFTRFEEPAGEGEEVIVPGI